MLAEARSARLRPGPAPLVSIASSSPRPMPRPTRRTPWCNAGRGTTPATTPDGTRALPRCWTAVSAHRARRALAAGRHAGKPPQSESPLTRAPWQTATPSSVPARAWRRKSTSKYQPRFQKATKKGPLTALARCATHTADLLAGTFPSWRSPIRHPEPGPSLGPHSCGCDRRCAERDGTPRSGISPPWLADR